MSCRCTCNHFSLDRAHDLCWAKLMADGWQILQLPFVLPLERRRGCTERGKGSCFPFKPVFSQQGEQNRCSRGKCKNAQLQGKKLTEVWTVRAGEMKLGKDEAGAVDSLCRESQSKTVWKTLPQGVNNLALLCLQTSLGFFYGQWRWTPETMDSTLKQKTANRWEGNMLKPLIIKAFSWAFKLKPSLLKRDHLVNAENGPGWLWSQPDGVLMDIQSMQDACYCCSLRFVHILNQLWVNSCCNFYQNKFNIFKSSPA